MLAFQLAHRQERLDEIVAGLARGPADADALARMNYVDLDPRLLPAARRNVLAGLIGLMDQGRVRARGRLTADTVFELA